MTLVTFIAFKQRSRTRTIWVNSITPTTSRIDLHPFSWERDWKFRNTFQTIEHVSYNRNNIFNMDEYIFK